MKDLLNFSLVNKRIHSCIEENWKYRLSKFKEKDKFFEGNKKKLYILLYRLNNLKNILKLKGDIWNIYNLKYLDLGSCNLETIPKGMKLVSLEELRMRYNQIRIIENLPISLKKLYLSYNKIKIIPPEIE
jgi:Leucine-rich repeat (LRR) protein